MSAKNIRVKIEHFFLFQTEQKLTQKANLSKFMITLLFLFLTLSFFFAPYPSLVYADQTVRSQSHIINNSQSYTTLTNNPELYPSQSDYNAYTRKNIQNIDPYHNHQQHNSVPYSYYEMSLPNGASLNIPLSINPNTQNKQDITRSTSQFRTIDRNTSHYQKKLPQNQNRSKQSDTVNDTQKEKSKIDNTPSTNTRPSKDLPNINLTLSE